MGQSTRNVLKDMPILVVPPQRAWGTVELSFGQMSEYGLDSGRLGQGGFSHG